MKVKKILREIDLIKKDYRQLSKELKNHALLRSKKNSYTKEDKESFLILWKKYIDLFSKLKKLIWFSWYRKYFFFIHYNKLVLRKFLLVFYFNSILEIEGIFGEHKSFIRVLLDENFKKDYGYFAKYIYRPRFVTTINTPNIFITPFQRYMDSKIYKLLISGEIEVNNKNRLSANYNNLFFYFKYRFDKLLFIVSEKVSYLISITRFSFRTKGLITKKNIDKYLKIAQPWDIFLTRWNWNASNISIPWFWKHMSLYVWKWSFLKKNFSSDFISDLDSKTHYVIEATWDGIKVVDIEKFISHNDYLGVSRTTFTKEKIYRSIWNSFEHIWKWYDYIFNFYSDKKLVCSELVMKSYTSEFKGDVWFDIQLENIWTSLVYPPNSFVSMILNEQNKKKSLLEPIFFIDSIEKTGENFVSTSEEFLESRKRSRLSLFLK